MTPNFLTAEIDLHSFWRWWTQELKALVPPKVLSFLGAETKQPIFMHMQGLQLAWFEKTPDGDQPITGFTLDEEGRRSLQRLLGEQPELRERPKILILQKHQGLARSIILPAATEDNLRQVLGYEMSRYTPFSEQELYYDVQVVAKNKETQQITAELIASPITQFNDIYEALSSWGMEIQAAGYEAAVSKRYNLLPLALRPKISRGPKLARNILAGSFVLLFAAIMLLPIFLQSRNLDELDAQLAVASKKVKDIEKIKSGAKSLLNDVNKLIAQKQNEPSMVVVLDELTQLLPKDTWLNSFQYANHKVQIQGLSASASALIGILEKSQYFDQVSFISPVIPDRESGRDRFQIAMSVMAGSETAVKQ